MKKNTKLFFKNILRLISDIEAIASNDYDSFKENAINEIVTNNIIKLIAENLKHHWNTYGQASYHFDTAEINVDYWLNIRNKLSHNFTKYEVGEYDTYIELLHEFCNTEITSLKTKILAIQDYLMKRESGINIEIENVNDNLLTYLSESRINDPQTYLHQSFHMLQFANKFCRSLFVLSGGHVKYFTARYAFYIQRECVQRIGTALKSLSQEDRIMYNDILTKISQDHDGADVRKLFKNRNALAHTSYGLRPDVAKKAFTSLIDDSTSYMLSITSTCRSCSADCENEWQSKIDHELTV